MKKKSIKLSLFNFINVVTSRKEIKDKASYDTEQRSVKIIKAKLKKIL